MYAKILQPYFQTVLIILPNILLHLSKYSRPYSLPIYAEYILLQFLQKVLAKAIQRCCSRGRRRELEICIGSTRRQECMEEAAKWQLTRNPCNLDTLSTLRIWVKIWSDLNEIETDSSHFHFFGGQTNPSLAYWTMIGLSEVAPRLQFYQLFLKFFFWGTYIGIDHSLIKCLGKKENFHVDQCFSQGTLIV